MSKKLNKEQRKFLEYLRDEHDSLGWHIRIKLILSDNEYDSRFCHYNLKREIRIKPILSDWEGMCTHKNETYLKRYGTPFKYLK